MTESEMKERTKRFALDVIRVVDALPKTVAGHALGGQLIRSGTSVAANYRAACRGRSKPEFVAKLGTCEEEVDESAFWLELIMDAHLLPPAQITPLHAEANELTAIFTSSIKTARARLAESGGRRSEIRGQRSEAGGQQ